MIPMIIGFFLILITRTNHEKQIRKLGENERSRLEQDFWKWRFGGLGLLLLTLFPLLEAGRSNSSLESPWRLSLMGVSLLVFVYWMTAFSRSVRFKLNSLKMPEDFIKAYLADRFVIALLLLTLYGKTFYDFYYRGVFQ